MAAKKINNNRGENLSHMEGRGEREVTKPAVESRKEGTEKFGRIVGVSAELTGKVASDLAMEGIPPESRLKVSAFTKKELLDEVGGLDFKSILVKAAEKGWKISIYNPGIAWTGDQWADREVRDNPNFREKGARDRARDFIQKQISREEKQEEQAKSAALDFLSEGGFDICLTLDPESPESFVSSLRADMVAKRFLMEDVERNLGDRAKGILSSINWSNGAYKEGALHRAIFQSISKKMLGEDTGDDTGIFLNEREAVRFGALYGKLGVDVYMGGGPANEIELATPFKLSSEIQLFRLINQGGLGLVNWLIKKARSLPTKYIPEKNRLLVTRIQEMAKGNRAENIEVGDVLLPIQMIMGSLIGEARLVTLADTSGSVVDSSRQMLGDGLRRMYRDKVIMIETHQEKPLPRLSGEKGFPAYSPAQHGELKRYGVLAILEKIVDEMRKGTFNQAGNEQERFVVVLSGAKKYLQKKGTVRRDNSLPQFGEG